MSIPSTLRFMFIPSSIDNFITSHYSEADEDIPFHVLEGVTTLHTQMNLRKIAIAVCSVAAVAFAALAIAFTSIPIAIIASVSLAALLVICLLTLQLYDRAIRVPGVITGDVEINDSRGSYQEYDL